MGCFYYGLGTGKCDLFYEENESLNPEGADKEGYCLAEDGEDPSWCQSYEDADADDEVCDYCGEPLGFCAEDCETREEDFEE